MGNYFNLDICIPRLWSRTAVSWFRLINSSPIQAHKCPQAAATATSSTEDKMSHQHVIKGKSLLLGDLK